VFLAVMTASQPDTNTHSQTPTVALAICQKSFASFTRNAFSRKYESSWDIAFAVAYSLWIRAQN